MRNIKVFFGITLTIIVVLLSFTHTQAIEYFSIGGKPAYPDPNIPNSISWFIYDLKEGERKEDALIVINTYNETLNLLVYAADGVKSSSGGFAVKQYVEPKLDVGAWVKFYPEPVPDIFTKLFKENNNSIIKFCDTQLGNAWSTEQKDMFLNWCKGEESVEFNLPANSNTTLKFVFSVPEDVSVGEHTGGILIQKVEPENDGNQQGISLTTRVGIRIYQTVPGEILREINIKSFVVQKMYKEMDFRRLIEKDLPPEEFLFTTEIENLGNVSINFSEKILIKKVFPKKSETLVDERKFQVLRDDVFTSNYSWFSPRVGKFHLQNTLIYENSKGEEETLESDIITVWIIPWREIVVGVGVLLLLTCIYLTIRAINRRRYSGKNWETYIVRSGETIEDISKKFGIKWRVFTKTNKLKPPYVLRTGQRVLVPKRK